MFPTVQIPKLVLEKTKESEQPFVQRYYISSNQALLYRLSGDTNRIHVEGTRGEDLFPTKQPIMHGLCVLGYAARAVLRTFVNSDEECNYIDCRFTLPLPVGEDIEVRMWQVDEQSMKGIILPEEGTRLIVFEVVSVKTGLVVVDGGIAGIVLRKEIPSQVVKGKQSMQKQSKL
jgi:3-hydroxyacyl-CoA dehydrogenase/3a,7a,12a-trihydroxy-5b-cholest-24-enoyl-CoA hydratase